MGEIRETTIRYTYDDLQAIPEDLAGRRYEIIDGRLVVKGVPAIRHQRVLGRLLVQMARLCEEFNLGEVLTYPVAVKLAEDQVPLPDLVFVSTERAGIDAEEALFGAPDLVVEVRSPGTAKFDRDVKRKRYLEYGVNEVWLVDPDPREVDVFRAGTLPATYRDGLPWRVGENTYELPLAKVFAGE